MTTPLNITLSDGTFFDLGALLLVLICVVCTGVLVMFTSDPTQDKLDQTNTKLDQIMETNDNFNQKLDTILNLIKK